MLYIVNPLSYVNSLINSIGVPETSIAEVTNVIKSLKESCPGWDHIPAFTVLLNLSRIL